MDLKMFDQKCVRITVSPDEVYEGTVSYGSEEYVFHEYGLHQEALLMTPILFCRDEILDIVSLEDVNGPFGHYSEQYGLLEKRCLQWGTDLIEEVFDTEDDIQIRRMLICINDHFQSLAERAVPGMAPWRKGVVLPEADDETGPVYLGELENMLKSLVKYNRNEEVVRMAENTLARLAKLFPEEKITS